MAFDGYQNTRELLSAVLSQVISSGRISETRYFYHKRYNFVQFQGRINLKF